MWADDHILDQMQHFIEWQYHFSIHFIPGTIKAMVRWYFLYRSQDFWKVWQDAHVTTDIDTIATPLNELFYWVPYFECVFICLLL